MFLRTFWAVAFLTCLASDGNSQCIQLDDVRFVGIYGALFVNAHKCTNSQFYEVTNYINTNLNGDTIFTIEDTNIGTLKPNFISSGRASKVLSLTLSNCKLKVIEKESIKQIPKLYNLTLYGNDIESFDSSYVAQNNRRFQHLNLTNNNISKLRDICKGLPTIKVLVVRDNPLGEIQESLFKDCVNLEYLDLSGTKLKSISDKVFTSTWLLNELMLQNNNFEDLELVYNNVTNLTFLDLSWNIIKVLDTKLFNYYPNVKILDMGYNKINSVISTGESIGLRQLFLNNNNITLINISDFKVLQKLDLSHNTIDDLPVHFFENAQQLRHLYLENNGLVELKLGVFSPLKNLVDLDISNNELIYLDEHIFTSVTRLETLDLSGNKLNSTFDPSLYITQFKTLKTFGLSKLSWSCKKLAYFINNCTRNNVSCFPKIPNYKTTNVHGLECTETQLITDAPEVQTNRAAKLISEEKIDPILNEYLNISNEFQHEQLKINWDVFFEVRKINIALFLLVVIFCVYMCHLICFAQVRNLYERKMKRENVLFCDESNLELLSPSIPQQNCPNNS